MPGWHGQVRRRGGFAHVRARWQKPRTHVAAVFGGAVGGRLRFSSVRCAAPRHEGLISYELAALFAVSKHARAPPSVRAPLDRAVSPSTSVGPLRPARHIHSGALSGPRPWVTRPMSAPRRESVRPGIRRRRSAVGPPPPRLFWSFRDFSGSSVVRIGRNQELRNKKAREGHPRFRRVLQGKRCGWKYRLFFRLPAIEPDLERAAGSRTARPHAT